MPSQSVRTNVINTDRSARKSIGSRLGSQDKADSEEDKISRIKNEITMKKALNY